MIHLKPYCHLLEGTIVVRVVAFLDVQQIDLLTVKLRHSFLSPCTILGGSLDRFWVAVEELSMTYYTGETLLVTIYTH